MNKRIDELWGQALDKAVPDTYSSLTWTQVEKIKAVFAELIVRECCNIAHVHSEGSELHDEGTLYYYMEDIAVKIKEHFGVGE